MCEFHDRPTAQANRTATQVVEDRFGIISALPLLYTENDTFTRDTAMNAIRTVVEDQQREIERLRAIARETNRQHSDEIRESNRLHEDRNAKLRQSLHAAQTKVRHVEYVARVTQQLSRLLHLELEFEQIGEKNEYIVSSGSSGFTATVNAEYYTIAIDNPAARMKVRTLSLDGSGLNDTAITVIAGMFHIRLYPGNTPKHTHEQLFEPDADAPEMSQYVKDLFARVIGGTALSGAGFGDAPGSVYYWFH